MSVRRRVDNLIRHFEKSFVTHNRIEVSKSALLHNFDLFAGIGAGQVIPVLKANAYGHGIEQVATALKDRQLPYIVVDGYFEALRIRHISKQPVLIMGAIAPQNFARIKYDDFAFVVHDEAAINALGKTGKQVKLHLECNTGMNRYGAKPSDVPALTKLILTYQNLMLEGVMSHLADSDGDDPQAVPAAVELFDQCVESARAVGANPTMIHVAQSAGSLKAKSKYANAMRLGISLYGINPFAPDHELYEKLNDLQPALRFVSTITQVIDIKQGEKVSYNYTFTAPHDMRIGVLPVGYYEGLNRALSNKASVKVGESFAPITGRICMNHTMINLVGIDVSEGSEVTIYSSHRADQNSIDAIAHKYDLFNYNLLTNLSPDVRRVLIG